MTNDERKAALLELRKSVINMSNTLVKSMGALARHAEAGTADQLPPSVLAELHSKVLETHAEVMSDIALLARRIAIDAERDEGTNTLVTSRKAGGRNVH